LKRAERGRRQGFEGLEADDPRRPLLKGLAADPD
jgi:hypothetical protein